MQVKIDEINFDSLKRGESIPLAQLRKAIPVSPSHIDWPLGLMMVSERIRAFFEKSHDDVVSISNRGGGVYIETHAEQAQTVKKRRRDALGKAKRAITLAEGVDYAELSQRERDNLDRERAYLKAWLEDARTRSKEHLRPKPHVRDVPLLAGVSEAGHGGA